jgi:8-oxo-dGTP pyrophosphatase MutT (NUDIX family)
MADGSCFPGARRELLEETGVSADPSGVAIVAESQLPGSSRDLLDVVFIATEPVLGREHGREAGLVPRFVRPDQMQDCGCTRTSPRN